MPGKRFWQLGSRIIDSHLLPKGWHASSKAERDAAVVYVEERYEKLSAIVEAGRHLRHVEAELNAGLRVPG